MTDRLRAAVIGLGQVAWRFDEEAGRRMVWTHCGAYAALSDDYVLTGACDSDSDTRAAFAHRYPEVPVADSIDDLMMNARPDVVSICTPVASHAVVLDAVLAAGTPAAIWCEKPLADELDTARDMNAACTARQAVLIVSHVRRWAPLWRRFKARLDDDEIGTLRCLRIAMPNRLWSIGSHAIDLLFWLGGAASEIRPTDIPSLAEDGEPARAAVINFRGDGYGILQVTGCKTALMVEAEAIGDRGRLCLREDQQTISFESFVESERYDGYRELANPSLERVAAPEGGSPFIEIAREIAGLVRGEREGATCDGHAALETQAGLEALATIDAAGEARSP